MGPRISRSIIESHGGRLWATTFRVAQGFVSPYPPATKQTMRFCRKIALDVTSFTATTQSFEPALAGEARKARTLLMGFRATQRFMVACCRCGCFGNRQAQSGAALLLLFGSRA